jgi:hypothetical protein
MECNDYENNMASEIKVDKMVAKGWDKGVNSCTQ